MNRLRRFASCTLVAAVATLAACSDAPTGASAPTDSSDSRAVSAANANAGASGSVARIGATSRSLSRVVAPATLNPRGRDFTEVVHALDPTPITFPCYAVMPSEGGTTAPTTEHYVDPCNPDPCTYDPASCDPCYPNLCPPPPPPPPSATATFSFGSDATAVSILPGTTLKTLRLVSFSQAITNVNFTTLDAAFKNVGAQTSCYNVAGQFDSSHASGFGSPLFLEASRSPAWQGVIRWQVDGTHGFSPVSGATGGGTVWSSDFTCG